MSDPIITNIDLTRTATHELDRYEANPTLENLVKIPEAERVFPSRHAVIPHLERRVVEAAVKWHSVPEESFDAFFELGTAIDALIAARERIKGESSEEDHES